MQIFDAHFHIIDKAYPLIPNQGYLPDEFTVDDYLACTQTLNISAGCIVSGSFQGYDQNYLIAALAKLGKNFVATTQLPFDATDETILFLNQQGIRGVRFNLYRGESIAAKSLLNFAKRVYELAHWHMEIYVDAKQLIELEATLLKLPSVSIDHLGLTKVGFNVLLRLVAKGIKVKASGFARVNFDVKTALTEIYAANPQSLIFGTDLPGTRAPRAFNASDIDLIKTNFSEPAVKQIFWDNAMAFYRLS
ncbi:MAG: amidohydrolase family protein [Pseudomonadota bacterium]